MSIEGMSATFEAEENALLNDDLETEQTESASASKSVGEPTKAGAPDARSFTMVHWSDITVALTAATHTYTSQRDSEDAAVITAWLTTLWNLAIQCLGTDVVGAVDPVENLRVIASWRESYAHIQEFDLVMLLCKILRRLASIYQTAKHDSATACDIFQEVRNHLNGIAWDVHPVPLICTFEFELCYLARPAASNARIFIWFCIYIWLCDIRICVVI
jgi:hypothetical protein